MPQKRIAWKDVWLSAFITGLGFTLGKYLLSVYFSVSGVNAAYGSAGAIILLLLWIYYSAQIFFFGVELSEAYAYQCGSLRNESEEHQNVVLPGGVAKAHS